MGYRTLNDESHVCEYCDTLIEAGQGMLMKYSPAQSDESLMASHFTHRVGHEHCIKEYGSRGDQEALIPFSRV